MKPAPESLPSRLGPSARQALLAATVLLACAATTLSSAPQQPAANQPPQYIEKSYPAPAGNEWPDKNSQMQMHDKLSKKKHFEAANLERKRQIDNDTAELLKLATDLKTDIDKSRNNTLSIDEIRKAELIEKLARGVKEKMKLTFSGIGSSLQKPIDLGGCIAAVIGRDADSGFRSSRTAEMPERRTPPNAMVGAGIAAGNPWDGPRAILAQTRSPTCAGEPLRRRPVRCQERSDDVGGGPSPRSPEEAWCGLHAVLCGLPPPALLQSQSSSGCAL